MSKYVQLTVSSGGAGADVSPLTNAGVPGVGLQVAADGEGLFVLLNFKIILLIFL